MTCRAAVADAPWRCWSFSMTSPEACWTADLRRFDCTSGLAARGDSSLRPTATEIERITLVFKKNFHFVEKVKLIFFRYSQVTLCTICCFSLLIFQRLSDACEKASLFIAQNQCRSMVKYGSNVYVVAKRRKI